MVLISRFNTRLLTILLFVFSVNACSLLSHQRQGNRSPDSPIIPVKASSPTPSANQNTKPRLNQASPQTQTNTASTVPKTGKLAPSDVLESVLESAKKAINMQQWLRAQHQLEHALRIAPKDAQVFWLYAQVYAGLGVQTQEINMLRRAKFLAKPRSDIYQLAKQKLAEYE